MPTSWFRLARVRPMCRTHGLFLTLLAGGVLLRIAATIAYRPALMFIGDSYEYVLSAQRLEPRGWHPMGYSVFLRLLWWTSSTMAVVVVQHLLGLLLGVGTYLLLQHLDVRRWLSALAAAPVLLDAYQVNVEQFLIAETLFQALLLGGLALLLLRRVTPGPAAAAGLLLAGATLTRTLGAAVAVLAIGLLALRRVGWRPVAALAAAVVVPLLAYASWFFALYGSFGLTSQDGRWLYGKVAPIARCESVTAELRPLCPAEPLSARENTTFYTWSGLSPYDTYPPPAGVGKDEVARRFALQVMRAQPGDYARLVGSDLLHYASVTRTSRAQDWTASTWRFLQRTDAERWMAVIGVPRLSDAVIAPEVPRLPQDAHWPAAVLGAYQRVGYLPGPALAALVVLALLAAGVREPAGDVRRRVALGLAGCGLALLVVPALTVALDVRYLLPSQMLLVPAGAVAADMLLRRAARRRARAATPRASAAPPRRGMPAQPTARATTPQASAAPARRGMPAQPT